MSRMICLEAGCKHPRLITDFSLIALHNKHDIRDLQKYIQEIRQDLLEDGLDEQITNFHETQQQNQDQLMKKFELAGQMVVSKIQELQKTHIQRTQENMESLKDLVRIYDDGEVDQYFSSMDKRLEHVLLNHVQVIKDVKLIDTFKQLLQNIYKESQEMLSNFMIELFNHAEVTMKTKFKEFEDDRLRRIDFEQRRQINQLEEQLSIMKSVYQSSDLKQQQQALGQDTPQIPFRDQKSQVAQLDQDIRQSDIIFYIVNQDRRMQIISNNAHIQDESLSQQSQLQLLQLLFLQRQQPNFKTYNDFSLNLAKKFKILSEDLTNSDTEILKFTQKFLNDLNLDHSKFKEYVFQICQIVLEYFQDIHFVSMKEILEELQVQCVINNDIEGQSDCLIKQGHLSFRLLDYAASKQFYEGGLDYIKPQTEQYQESLLKILRYNKNFKSKILTNIFKQLVQSLEAEPNQIIDIIDVFQEFQSLSE